MKKIIVLCGLALNTLTLPSVHKISSSKQFDQLVRQSDGPVLVKFSADWCGICDDIEQPFNQVMQEEEFADITFAVVDIDQMNQLSTEYGIIGMPTLLYFKAGQKKNQMIGVTNLDTFQETLRTTLRTTFNITSHAQQIASDGAIVQEQTDRPQEETLPDGLFDKIKAFILWLIQKIQELFASLLKMITW